MLTKGGPDVMFKRSRLLLVDRKEQPLTEEKLNEVREANEAFSNDALRVLAYGYKKLPAGQSSITEEDEHDLVLVGLTAMVGPPREAVYGSIEEAKHEGC